MKKSTSFLKKTSLLSGALATSLLVVFAAHAIHDNGFFEVDDGDTVHDMYDDANDIFNGTSSAFDSLFSYDNMVPDQTYFGAGDKDTQAVADLDCTTPKNVGPKFNILHGYSAAYTVPNNGGTDVMLVAGADRESNNGSANIGLWLFKQEVGCDPASGLGFQGEKSDGDVFLVSEFTGGGRVSTVIVYRWNDPDGVPDSGDEVLGRLDDPDNSVVNTGVYNGDETLYEDEPFISGVDCQDDDPHGNGGSEHLCATVNSENITPAWTSDVREPGQYFEAAINLTQVLGQGTQICFNSFMLETRSSFETGAKLKDFVGGELNTCGSITIRKQVDGPDHLSKDGTFGFTPSSSLGSPFSIATDATTGTGLTEMTYVDVLPGSYTVVEGAPTGTFALADISCDDSSVQTTDDLTAQILLNSGDDITCTFINTRLAAPGRIEIYKQTVGGFGSFDISTTPIGVYTADLITLTTTATQNPSLPDVLDPATEGTYTFTETVPAGWELTGLTCTDPNNPQGPTLQTSVDPTAGVATVVIDDGETVSCTFTNSLKPQLKLVKTVTNDNGGTAGADDWLLAASGDGGFSNAGGSGVFEVVENAVTYTLSESGGPAGYSTGSWSCDGGTQVDNQITLSYGDAVTCTINNDDITPHLTLVKTVTNDNGGTALITDWTLYAAGPTPISGAGGADSDVNVGTYTLSESAGPAGYSASSWSCVGGSQSGDQITLALAESATCTINNDDITSHLTLVKEVTNDNGGEAVTTDWTLSAAGPTPISGAGGADSDVNAGIYTLSESAGPAGYSASSWSCVGGSQSGDQITLALAESATCTIVNNDQPPSLTLEKIVINDSGGMASASDWTLTAAGPTGFAGLGPIVNNGPGFYKGTYDLSEAGPDFYTASDWVCVGGTQDDADTVTIALGESATCTITNDDVQRDICEYGKPATLILQYDGDPDTSDPLPQISSEVIIDPVAASLPANAHIEVFDHTGVSLGVYAVSAGGTFEVRGTKSKIPPRMMFKIYADSSLTDLRQTVQFHTSCSQPLEAGDEYGGITVWSYGY